LFGIPVEILALVSFGEWSISMTNRSHRGQPPTTIVMQEDVPSPPELGVVREGIPILLRFLVLESADCLL